MKRSFVVLALVLSLAAMCTCESESEVSEASGSAPVKSGQGVAFESLADAKLALAQRRLYRVFPLARVLSGIGGLIVFAACFGALGGVLRLLKQRVLDKRHFDDLPVFLAPALSGLSGCLLLGVAIALPTFLTTSTEVEPRPLTLLILCFLGGMMSERLYQWFEELFRKIFGSAEEKGDEE